MPAQTHLDDIGSGHSCHFPPTKAIEGSPNVFVNGKQAVRVGDAYAAHGCLSCPVLSLRMAVLWQRVHRPSLSMVDLPDGLAMRLIVVEWPKRVPIMFFSMTIIDCKAMSDTNGDL